MRQMGRLNSDNLPPSNSLLGAKLPRRGTSRVGKMLLFLGLALLVVTVGVAGAYLYGGSAFTPASTTQARATVQPTPTPTVHMQHQLLAKQYVAQMSLDDEIAQLLMVEHYSADYTDLATMMSEQHVGSVILYKTAIVSRSQVQGDISDVQQHSTIPIFVSIDEEGWNVGRLGSLYPNYYSYRMDANAIGLTGDPNVAAQQGEQAAKDLLSLGINMNLAPDVDVSTDDGYIGYDRRSFGSTPDAVIKYAGPYLKGLQGNGVVGTIKHFPGLGSIPKGFDPHAVLPEYTGTKDQLYQTDIVPFKHFIQDTDPNEQAYVIMSTDMLVEAIDPTYPAELSHTFITDILRNQLGFQGVILSDSLHMGGVLVNGEALTLADACVLALEAGNDILEGAKTSAEVEAIIEAINAAVQSGKVTKAQIDASVTRVLTLKMDFNVMPAVPPSSVTPTPTSTP
jgi:beta-N-acetylhexosaminidase